MRGVVRLRKQRQWTPSEHRLADIQQKATGEVDSVSWRSRLNECWASWVRCRHFYIVRWMTVMSVGANYFWLFSWTQHFNALPLPLAVFTLLVGAAWLRTRGLGRHGTRTHLSHRGTHSQCLLLTSLNSTWQLTNVICMIWGKIFYHNPVSID